MKTFILLTTLSVSVLAMSFSNTETDSYSTDYSSDSEYIEVADTSKKKKKKKGEFKKKFLKGTKGLRNAAMGEPKKEESKSGLTISEEAIEEEEEK